MTATTTDRPPQPVVSERVKGERRLGLWLSAPSFVVMILVTAYPLVYAVVLSLYNYRLTDPGGREFVGTEQLLRHPAATRCGGTTS